MTFPSSEPPANQIAVAIAVQITTDRKNGRGLGKKDTNTSAPSLR